MSCLSSSHLGCGSQTLKCFYDPGNRYCPTHGPALRKGKPWFLQSRAPFGGPGLSPPLPTPGQRWAQVLKRAQNQPRLKGLATEPGPTGEWQRQLEKALNVEFQEAI
jgi:hypothetical protein